MGGGCKTVTEGRSTRVETQDRLDWGLEHISGMTQRTTVMVRARFSLCVAATALLARHAAAEHPVGKVIGLLQSTRPRRR